VSGTELYIGLMSGTSVDGIDAALVDFSNNKTHLIEFSYLPFDLDIQHQIQTISHPDIPVLLKDYGTLDAHLGQLFAQAVKSLLKKTDIPASSIKAIGSHGQTVYHAPDGQWPFSLQIGDPNIIAEQTGITTIADFRRRDIAAKGQGAPLVPAFHQAVFALPEENRCIVNIGGIANITVLPKNQSASITGFDTGPGNTLMDCWINKHQHLNYDKNGDWAQSGSINFGLVELLKQDTYFSATPPKSTGKEYFSLSWLYKYVDTEKFSPKDIQATLCFLSASTICDAIKLHAPDTERVLICGGGIHNRYLLQLIHQQLNCPVESTAEYGIHPDHVEAVAFAWLARQTLNHLPGNLKDVTGAKNSVILGGIYPGNSN
jgi:anhydro-N-acetylmuramic acid kinase